MDSGPAPPPSYNATPEIPPEIFQPLLTIAQRGYDANDIRSYYLIMLRHLRRMGAENAEAAYTLVTPVSDKKVPLFNDEDAGSIEQSTEPSDDHVSPKTNPNATGWSWSRSPSYEPSYEPSIQATNEISVIPFSQQNYDQPAEQQQEAQIEIPPAIPPRPLYTHGRTQSMPVMPAHYGPMQSNGPQFDMNEICQEPAPYGGESSRAPNQYFSPDAFNGPYHSPPVQFAHPWLPAPNTAPYQMAMSNTAMPVLVPFHPPPQQEPQRQPSYIEDLVAPFSQPTGLSALATELYTSPFFPTIDIIPSRKRRKVLQKGAKRIVQSMQASRQDSV